MLKCYNPSVHSFLHLPSSMLKCYNPSVHSFLPLPSSMLKCYNSSVHYALPSSVLNDISILPFFFPLFLILFLSQCLYSTYVCSSKTQICNTIPDNSWSKEFASVSCRRNGTRGKCAGTVENRFFTVTASRPLPA